MGRWRVVSARRRLVSVIAFPVSSQSAGSLGAKAIPLPESVPSVIGDADPAGVRAGWSPGAVTGQRGSAGLGWPRRRRAQVSGVVLVVAAVLRGAVHAVAGLGPGVVSVEASHDARYVLTSLELIDAL
jgi:hypothetical protein